jgi:nitroimidazol reductase NimA-like FMN-containing flavoprotein (pyridoxamine 5'-phosphate oxidase superfamily)
MEPVRRIEVLDRSECMTLLSRCAVGRLAWVPEPADGPPPAPAVVPVSYTVDGASVVIRTTHGSRMGREAPGRAVAFEVDEVRRGPERVGWSVVASGVAHLESDPVETDRLAARLQAWAPGFKDLWLRVPLDQVSGRRVGSAEREIELPDHPAPRWREHEGWTPPTRTPAEFASDFDGR